MPARIVTDLPEARLVAVLRNPVDRAVSAWFHLMKSGFLPVLPVEEGLPKLLDDPGFVAAHPRAAEVLEFGLYDRYLAGYDAFAERGRLLVMLHEDVLADPLARVRAVYRHLGVDDGFHPGPALAARPQAVVYAPSRLRLLGLRPRLLYRFSADGARMTGRRRNPLRKAAAAAVVGLDRAVLARVFGNAKPKLSTALRSRLQDFYRQDTRRLERRLGRGPLGLGAPLIRLRRHADAAARRRRPRAAPPMRARAPA